MSHKHKTEKKINRNLKEVTRKPQTPQASTYKHVQARARIHRHVRHQNSHFIGLSFTTCETEALVSHYTRQHEQNNWLQKAKLLHIHQRAARRLIKES
jgi:hypothetical protein